jgi:hypothetical protein
MGDQCLIPIGGRYFSLLHDIVIGSGDHPTSCLRGYHSLFSGGVRWMGHKADWVPRSSMDLPHVFRMWPWLVVGTVVLCVRARIISVKITGTEFCPVKVWKKGSEILFTKWCRISR